MNFPFIPISYLIADVKAELKKMDLAGEIDEEDCLNYIVEVMREIGGANYPDKAIVLQVRNNVVQLPADFYVVDELWLCSSATGHTMGRKTIGFTYEGKSYIGTQRMHPGDATTGTSFNKHINRHVSERGAPTYIIRNRQLRCSVPTATLGLLYTGLPMEEGGQMLIQDEVNTTRAAKAYCKKMLLSEKFYSGQLPQYIWQDLSKTHEVHVDQAQAIFKFPDPADDEARGDVQDSRYDAFNLK